MKSIWRNWAKISVCFFLVGVFLLGISWAFGMRGGFVYIDAKGLHVVSQGNADEGLLLVNEENTEPFTAVDIYAVSADVELIKSDHFGLEMRLPKGSEPVWGIENGVLSVKEQVKWSIFTIVNFDFITNAHFVKIYYPASLEIVDLKTISGNIKANANNSKSLTVKSTSGNLKIKGSGNVTLSTISGDVNADLERAESIEISTTSGNISVENDYDGETNLKINTISGTIRADGNVWKNAQLKSTSGDIKVGGDFIGKTEMKSISGNVNLDISGDIDKYGYELKSLSGSMRVGNNRFEKNFRSFNADSAKNIIVVQTTSGDIRLDFDD